MKLEVFLTDKQVTEIKIGDLKHGKRRVEVPLPQGTALPEIKTLPNVVEALMHINHFLACSQGSDELDESYALIQQAYELIEKAYELVAEVQPEREEEDE